jgi:autotransporter-associated beta strand protein
MEKNLKLFFHQKASIDKRPFTQAIFVGVVVALLGWGAPANAQNLISNGGFDNGLTDWTQASWAGGSSFGINANGPTDTSAASGNYAYAGGSTFNLLQQNVTVTTGSAYRLTFLAGGKSGQGNANGVLSLRQEALSNYNSASFDYQPSDAVFGSYTVDFVADTTTIGLWLRSDSTYEAYDNVSVTPIASVANALNYTAASGYSQISSALTGSGKVTVNAGTGGLALAGANTHTGGTEVTGGTLFVAGAGTLGATDGAVTVSGGGTLDLRNQQTRTGTISMNNQDAKIISGDVNNPGSIVNNGGAFQFGGGLLAAPLSGSGGLNVTGGGSITSANSYAGATTISGTTGWYGTDQLYVNNANALGAASGDLTISGGSVNLQSNTITRSGNVTISGGTINSGTISKSGSNFDVQGGLINAALAGTAGLTKSGAGNSAIYGANTYSGDTVIDQGTLVVGLAEGLGNATAAVTVNSGGALYLGGGLTVERTGDVTVNGGSLTTDNANMGTISVSGGNFIANNAAILAVKLAGTAGLTVGGAGETYLWTDSSYSGATVISSGTLILGGVGAISSQSRLQIDSGAAVNLTGLYAANNINRTFAGLTGEGILSGGGGTVTINQTSDTDIFSGVISGGTGLIKSGAGTLALGGASSYTGSTYVNEGRLVVAHADALGGTDGGTVVASGAQLRINSLADTVFPAEPLIISGQGLPSGGALRNAANNNIWQATITLAANATIGAASGTTLTLAAASGATLNLGDYDLVVDGAGTVQVNGGIAGSGQISKTGSGQLVISNSVLVATIQSNSITVTFASAPTAGTYAVLSGPVDSASLTGVTVTGLSSGQTATVANSPNLVVQVTDGPTDPTFEGTYAGINPLAINPANGLSYLMNYALGGTGPSSSPALPVLTSNASSLTLTANIRNSGQGVVVIGQYAYDLAGQWYDVVLTPTGASSSVENTTVKSFSQAVESGRPRKFLRLKAVAP